MIDSVKVVRRGKVRRAKLYYLRDRRGKSARIAERVETPGAKGGRQGSRQGARQGIELDANLVSRASKAGGDPAGFFVCAR